MPQDPAIALFETQRPRLLRLAYRMLGSLAEAEDVVQEAWLRWQRADRSGLDQPAAWLTRVVSRLCLDVMKSARMRHESYAGHWLPEPLIESGDDELRADDLTLTLMLALERLSPLERAAFLLHDVFEVPLSEIADTLGREKAAVRQLASRARRNVRSDQPRYPIDRKEGDRIARAFFDATQTGDIQRLQTLLAEGVEIHSDGGGKVLSFPNVIRGIARTLRLYEGLFHKFGPVEQMLRLAWIDGLPGYVSLYDGVLQTTAFEIRDGRIAAVYMIRNPDKLAHVPAEDPSRPH